MKAFADDALPAAVGIGVGILCAINGYSAWGTLGFVTMFYLLLRIIFWRYS